MIHSASCELKEKLSENCTCATEPIDMMRRVVELGGVSYSEAIEYAMECIERMETGTEG